jgi:hypothetical protein
VSPRRPSDWIDEERALLVSALLDEELEPRDAELARELIAEDAEAQQWLDAAATLGEIAREVWDEPDARPRIAAEAAPAYAPVSFVRANGVPYRARRSPRNGSSET